MFLNRCYDNMGNVSDMNNMGNEMNMNTNMNMSMVMMGCCHGCTCSPVMECPQERVCHRQMCYEVPQECPFLIDQGK